ncbi:hypothetical protein YC2023_018905 [Brassica napus]
MVLLSFACSSLLGCALVHFIISGLLDLLLLAGKDCLVVRLVLFGSVSSS